MSSLDYTSAVAVLADALRFGMDPSLGPIEAMLEALGHPERSYGCVQVAGTNGKSSVARFTAAALAAHGLRVGLYTSPHLVSYEERIEIAASVVDRALFADGISAALDAARDAGVEATEFELLTAAAFELFAREGVDVAVLECGLGGRWDATSACDPDVAVVTGIALDHTAVLGDTTRAIAAEKAAIIKPGATVVLAEGIAERDVFAERAREVGARVVDAGPLDADGVELAYEPSGAEPAYESSGVEPAYDAPADAPAASDPLHLPAYQLPNVRLALAAAREFLAARPGSAPAYDAARALRAALRTPVPGRFELVRADPPLLIDAAHNPASAHVLARELSSRDLALGQSRIGTLVIGVLADKDARGIVSELAGLFDRVIATASPSPRSLAPADLAAVIENVTGRAPETAPTVEAALSLLGSDAAIATGSITIAGEVHRILQ